MFFIKAFAMIIIGELIRPKPKIENPKPTALGDFQVPTAQEGRAIPVVWGTVRIKGPNVTWYGDYKTVAIKQKQKTGLFSSTKITVGYKYYLGVQCALCHGSIDDFIGLRLDEKTVTLNSKTTTTDLVTFTMNQLELFGKPKEEGGVSGPVDVYRGTYTQTQSEYLRTKLGEPEIPAYRPISYVLFKGCYLGNSGRLPQPEFDIRRCPNPLALTGGKHNINGDANPANMIYEVLTERLWGMGIAASIINTASFVAAGNTLADEGLGLSMIVDSEQGGENLITEILTQIDGVIYSDFATGQLYLALTRNDYTVASLPVFDESNIVSGSLEFSRASWEDTQNTVKVKYLDRSQNFTERVIQHQNLANISARGGQIEAEEYDYSGVSNATTANKIAAKVLRTVSSPLSRVNFDANRDGTKLRTGSVFKLSWPELGIESVVYRVANVDYGSLDSPTVKISAVEDAFSVSTVAYSTPPPSGWVDPIGTLQDLTDVKLMETPYALNGDERRFVMLLAAQRTGQEVGYQVWADLAGGTTYKQTNTSNDMSALGQLSAAYNRGTATDSGFTLNNLKGAEDLFSDVAANEGWLILIDDELVYATGVTYTDTTATFTGVTRGVLDTVPADHASAATAWIISGGYGLLNPSDPLAADGTVRVKLLPFSVGAPLNIVSATARTLSVLNRAARPYPPARVRVAGVAYPATASGTVTVSWEGRNRLTQTSIVNQDATGITHEDGTTYNLRIYVDATNALIVEKLGITAKTATFNLATLQRVHIELRASRAGKESYYAQKIAFDYDPAGSVTNAITADTSPVQYVLDGGAP